MRLAAWLKVWARRLQLYGGLWQLLPYGLGLCGMQDLVVITQP